MGASLASPLHKHKKYFHRESTLCIATCARQSILQRAIERSEPASDKQVCTADRRAVRLCICVYIIQAARGGSILYTFSQIYLNNDRA